MLSTSHRMVCKYARGLSRWRSLGRHAQKRRGQVEVEVEVVHLTTVVDLVPNYYITTTWQRISIDLYLLFPSPTITWSTPSTFTMPAELAFQDIKVPSPGFG
jgi:hypothetical protein